LRRRLRFVLLSSSLLVVSGLTGSIVQSDPIGPCGWRRVPSENIDEPGDNLLLGIDGVSSDDVWAVGIQGGNPYSTLVEHWDGTAWTVVPSPSPSDQSSELMAVSAASSSDAWAVGEFFNSQSNTIETLILHWDGVAWTVVPSPSPGSTNNDLLDVVAIDADDAWAVGSMLRPDGALVLHWDGQSWTVADTPDLGESATWYSVAATSSSDVWVAGWAGRPLTMHWDGSTWTVRPTSFPNGTLLGITALPFGDAWVAGHTFPGERTLVEHWDGAAWARLRTPSLGDATNNLFGVDAISPDDVWAAGSYYNSHERGDRPLMLHWDGEQWTATGRRDGPREPSRLADVSAISSTAAWAAGWGPGQDRSLTLQYEC
jgi:hypothetical protein